jgi:hypothetical protein
MYWKTSSTLRRNSLWCKQHTGRSPHKKKGCARVLFKAPAAEPQQEAGRGSTCKCVPCYVRCRCRAIVIDKGLRAEFQNMTNCKVTTFMNNTALANV